MNTLEVLRAAREYISDPARWSPSADGYLSRPGAPLCALGAIIANGGHRTPVAWDAAAALGRVLGISLKSAPRPTREWYAIGIWNDSHTHAEVLALFDRAIAIEEAKAAEFDATPEPAPLVAA